MEVDQAQPLTHGHPAIPVGDLFPLVNSVFGDGSRGSLRPIRAREFRSHSAMSASSHPLPQTPCQEKVSGSRKRGVEFKGGSLHDGLAVLTVLAVLGSTLPSVCLSYKIQHSETTVAVLTVLADCAVMVVSVMTATPLKHGPFSEFLIFGVLGLGTPWRLFSDFLCVFGPARLEDPLRCGATRLQPWVPTRDPSLDTEDNSPKHKKHKQHVSPMLSTPSPGFF